MGLYLVLSLDPEGIDPDAWAQAYDETVAMLEAWRPPLLTIQRRQIEGRQLSVLTRSLRSPDGQEWSIAGDAESVSWAGTQRMRRDLSQYRDGDRPPVADMVLEAVVGAKATAVASTSSAGTRKATRTIPR